MTELYKGTNKFVKSKAILKPYLGYLFLVLAGNASVWAWALFYLKVTPPVYESSWTISLPAAVTNTKITLPDAATATTERVSPYAYTTQDPRENYKFLASSEALQKAAAAQLKMTPKEFGQPRIKIVENTTLMSFQTRGKSSEEAQKKSFAYYKAFQEKLNELRAEETAQREAKFQGKITEIQKKLRNSQKRLADYQVGSGFASNVQIEQLSANIAQLRKQRADVLVQQQQSATRLKELSTNLDVTASQATDIVTLKADQLFQQYLKDYTETTAKLVVLRAKYLPNHPAVLQEQSKLNSIKAALQTRSVALLGRPIELATLEQFNIDQNGSTREALVKELVTSQVDQQGYASSVQEIDRQTAQLEAKLKMLTQSASNVEALRRDMQIDEAVFSSTLASLDARNSDVFGSYPEIQLVARPSLSDEPVSPKKKLVLLGAGLSTLFSIAGLVLFGLRKFKKVRKKTVNAKILGL